LLVFVKLLQRRLQLAWHTDDRVCGFVMGDVSGAQHLGDIHVAEKSANVVVSGISEDS
jgi:hypothetical protein